MIIKNFANKKINIRKLARKDLLAAKKFQSYINSLIAEDAKILMQNKQSEREEQEWLKERLESVKKHKSVLLLAEDNNIIAGICSVDLGKERHSHIGTLSVSVRKEYRRIGLGTYLIKAIIDLAKKQLKPKPKLIQLKAFVNNKPAINLYQKLGFKKAARLPDQIQFKEKLIDEFIMLLYLS